ncbi:MAG: beta-galactosidase [Planctomycetota bacterium]
MRLPISALMLAFIGSATGHAQQTDGAKVQEEQWQRRITSVQPMTGIVLWSDHEKVETNAIALEFRYCGYDEIAVAPGRYDFTRFDEFLDKVAKRGHQAVVRFRFVYPGKTTTLPSFVLNAPDYEPTIAKSEGKRTHFCDWSSSTLQTFTLDFYTAFAKRYDRDPRLAFLQTGFGLWAEYHIYDGPRKLGKNFPDKAYQTRFLNHLTDVFDDLPWSISVDAADNTYSPIEDNTSLLRLPFGVFDDSFLCRQHARENEVNWTILNRSRWKTSPAGGELSYYTRRDQKLALSQNGPHGVSFSDLASQFHVTYMIGNDQPNYQSMDAIKAAGMRCGYRFRVQDVDVIDNQLHLSITNTGIAPLYRDAFFASPSPQRETITRSDVTLKGLLPGEIRDVVLPAVQGWQDRLHIVSDHLVPGQTIEFEAGVVSVD